MQNNILQLLLFPEKAKDIALSMVEQIESGEISPLTLAANMSKLEKVIKAIKEDSRYSEAVLNSLSRRGSIVIGDMKVEEMETSIKYDYFDCGDTEILRLYDSKIDLEDQIKKREAMLKGLPGRTPILDEATGEVVNMYPPSRSSKTTYKVTEIKTKLKK